MNMPVLDPDEKRVIRFRRHWAVNALHLGKAVAIIVGLKLLMWAVHVLIGSSAWLVTTLLWFGCVATLGWLVWRLALHWVDIVIFTDRRMIRTYGLFRTVTDWAPLPKITDMQTVRTPIGHLLGYGSMLSETAGRDSLRVVRFIPNPSLVSQVIAHLKFGSDD